MPRKTSRDRPGPAARPRGFNEAAARCRGKHAGAARNSCWVSGFNEAAARCRGKPRAMAASASFFASLQ